MDKHIEASLHRRKFGQTDRMTTTGTVGELVQQFQSLPKALQPEYSIMIGAVEYGPHEIEALARGWEE